MEKKQEKRSISLVVGDALLTVFSVAVLAFTFYGLGALTPKTTQQTAQKDSNVLGAQSENTGKLIYFPQSIGQLPFVKSSAFSGTMSGSGEARSTVTFKALEASTYEFKIFAIKNTSAVDKVVLITPQYSLEGSYTKISLKYEGQTIELVATNGKISPVEMIVSANTTTPVTIVVQPTKTIQVQPTLSLVFTEKR